MKTILLYTLLSCPVFGQPQITQILVGSKQIFLSFTTPVINQTQYVVWYRPMTSTNWAVLLTPTATGSSLNVAVNLQPPGLFRVQQVYRGP